MSRIPHAVCSARKMLPTDLFAIAADLVARARLARAKHRMRMNSRAAISVGSLAPLQRGEGGVRGRCAARGEGLCRATASAGWAILGTVLHFFSARLYADARHPPLRALAG